MATWSTTKLLDSSGHTATAGACCRSTRRFPCCRPRTATRPARPADAREQRELDLAVDGQGAVIAFLDKLFQLVLVRIGIECQQEDGRPTTATTTNTTRPINMRLNHVFIAAPSVPRLEIPMMPRCRALAGGRAAGVLKSICLRRQIPSPARSAARRRRRSVLEGKACGKRRRRRHADIAIVTNRRPRASVTRASRPSRLVLDQLVLRQRRARHGRPGAGQAGQHAECRPTNAIRIAHDFMSRSFHLLATRR